MSNFKAGDSIIVSGYTAQGVIHADRIVYQWGKILDKIDWMNLIYFL